MIDAPKPYYRLTDGVKPDHWFDAVQVWEVKAADLSISPVYTAAAGIVSEGWEGGVATVKVTDLYLTCCSWQKE